MTLRPAVRAALVLPLALFTAGTSTAVSTPVVSTVLQRFLHRSEAPVVQYRAFRRLDAKSDHLRLQGWLEAWTELDRGTFRYQIVAEGGSASVRQRVLKATLEAEERAWTIGEAETSDLTLANYQFLDAESSADGLVQISIKPRRKARMLVDGVILVRPDDAELLRVEGLLAKSPSFWTRRVEIVRYYGRLAGVRLPTAIESVAQVLMAGRSTFSMTYRYATVNGRPVSDAPLRAAR